MNATQFTSSHFRPNGLLVEEFYRLDQDFFPNPWSLDQWQQIDWGRHILGTILEEGELIGFCLASLPSDKEAAHLYKILTHRDFRYQGIGSRILGDLIERLKENEISAIYLEVESSNEGAISLYEKLGFKKLHLAKNFYGTERHAFKMLLDL